MDKIFKYVLILILSIIVLVLARYVFGYLSGSIYLDENHYAWFAGEAEDISYYENPARSEIDLCETGITIKLKNSKTYFSIIRESNWNPCYWVIDHPVFLEKSKTQNLKVALQLKKTQIERIKQGALILPNPYVRGLKMGDKTIFTIEDLNKGVSGEAWFRLPVSILVILIALFAILATVLSLFPNIGTNK